MQARAESKVLIVGPDLTFVQRYCGSGARGMSEHHRNERG